MLRFVLPTTLLLATPVWAEEAPPSLLERGAQMFLEGLLEEVEPRLEDLQDWVIELGPALQGFVEEMGPAFTELLKEVEDWTAYHPPEILENGDIIIRRRQIEDPEQVPEQAPKEPIDL